MAALGQAEADARVSTAVPPAEALHEAVWAMLATEFSFAYTLTKSFPTGTIVFCPITLWVKVPTTLVS